MTSVKHADAWWVKKGYRDDDPYLYKKLRPTTTVVILQCRCTTKRWMTMSYIADYHRINKTLDTLKCMWCQDVIGAEVMCWSKIRYRDLRHQPQRLTPMTGSLNKK